MPAKRYCCVIGCNNSEQNSRHLKFYSFPRNSHEIDRRKKWIQAVRRVSADNKPWEPNVNSRICSAHFVGGAKSTIEKSPAYIPTIFPPIYKKRALSQAAAARHDRLRKRKISNPSEVHVEAVVQENVETGLQEVGETSTSISVGCQTDAHNCQEQNNTKIMFLVTHGPQHQCHTSCFEENERAKH
ncbi:THAP domain-containing protein 11-like [Vanessa tameamea]|uniref:THAP domain-containing protein 11-like n=1 Tax=Vanessa tameamea TaxID=334116 RepID=A0A8B8IIP5_VANTA